MALKVGPMSEEVKAEIQEALSAIKDRVSRENKKMRKEYDSVILHQKYLLDRKRDQEQEYDRENKEWLRWDQLYKDDTEKLAKIFGKYLGPNVKGLVRGELEKKEYYLAMEKIQEHYINFDVGNYTSLFRMYLNTRLQSNQSVDSLAVYMNTLIDYLNRLQPDTQIEYV